VKLLAVLALVPVLALGAPPANPKFVDVWSRMDEFNAARGVQKAAVAHALKPVEKAPDEGVDALVSAFLDANQNTGLLVLKGDTILAERYQYERTAQHRFSSASMAKTVLSMLVGIAVSEKFIKSIDDRAEQYVPELKGHPYGETSIRHLLTMSSGMAFNEAWGGARDEGNLLVENTLRGKTEGGADAVLDFKRREAPAGTRFHYASGDSEVLGLVLRAAVGVPLATYLSEKIWQPMGAEANATWLVDKGGYETGYCCLNATLRDYGRFGLLLANYGKLDGKQIVPAEWVKAAVTPDAPYLAVGVATRYNGYGYQTWILGDQSGHPRGGGDPSTGDADPYFAAFGIYGQSIFVDPASKLVVVHTAAWTDPNDRDARGRQFQLFYRLLIRLAKI
jgi:CubicO group peptidase (beta-lactamase class C family)